MADKKGNSHEEPRDNAQIDVNAAVDMLFIDVLGPEYWAADSGISRRSWEILLLRKAMLDDHNWSLAECAERYGISRERVRQLEAEAVQKLFDWKQERDRRRMQGHKPKRGVYRRSKLPSEHLCYSERCLEVGRSVFRKHNTFAELRESLLRRLEANAPLLKF